MNLTDRSSDRRFLTFAISDLSRGRLDTLPLEGSGERRPVEIFHSDMRIFDPKFSPDSRFLSYLMIDKANKMEVFVRPLIRRRLVDRGRFLQAAPARIWRRDGKELYYVAPDQAVMVADVRTSPTLSFTTPRVPFRQDAKLPDRVSYVSADGERFLAPPPARGPQLQQLTIFDRQGAPMQSG